MSCERQHVLVARMNALMLHTSCNFLYRGDSTATLNADLDFECPPSPVPAPRDQPSSRRRIPSNLISHRRWCLAECFKHSSVISLCPRLYSVSVRAAPEPSLLPHICLTLTPPPTRSAFHPTHLRFSACSSKITVSSLTASAPKSPPGNEAAADFIFDNCACICFA